jgi:hypothetical protein
MARNRGPARALGVFGAALLILTGCDRLSNRDTEWARAALARNPDLTIVASDKDANTFTVQVKGSSELRVVSADEVIGALPSTAGTAPAAAGSSETAKATPPAEAAPAPASPASESSEPSREPATAREPARPASEEETRSAASASANTNTGVKSGTGFITDSKGRTHTFGGAEPPKPDAGAAAAGEQPKANGKVLAVGPGYTVTAGEPRSNRTIRLAEATELKSPSNAPVEERFDPMICQGKRLLQINGRNIVFDGDGLSALDGCELHITNSHIIAHGVGLSVRAANVRIQNSIIEGDNGSVSASEGAKVYTQQSTFKGLSRRLDTATFEDLGGTNWD